MTAEVAILNRGGVALAADSAATVGGKVFNSANKIFAVTRHYPVGLMIFGNARFMGVPWETVVKSFRSHLNDRCFGELEDYAKCFFDYLESNIDIFDKQYCTDTAKHNISRLADALHLNITEETALPRPSKVRFRNALGKKIDRIHSRIRGDDDVPDDREDDFRALIERFDGFLNDLIDKKFKGLITSERRRKRLKVLLISTLTNPSLTNDYTGIVFAGFGGLLTLTKQV